MRVNALLIILKLNYANNIKIKLGCSQAVRQWVLVSSVGGSNPPTPDYALVVKWKTRLIQNQLSFKIWRFDSSSRQKFNFLVARNRN